MVALEVIYRLKFRQEGQRVWRNILRSDNVLTKAQFNWETESIPDGWYVVQVEASDELDNPGSLTLRDTRDSEPLRIDNPKSGRSRDRIMPVLRLLLRNGSAETQFSGVPPTAGVLLHSRTDDALGTGGRMDALLYRRMGIPLRSADDEIREVGGRRRRQTSPWSSSHAAVRVMLRRIEKRGEKPSLRRACPISSPTREANRSQV